MSFLSFLFHNDKKKEEDFNKSVGQATNNFLSFIKPVTNTIQNVDNAAKPIISAGVKGAENTPAMQITNFIKDLAVATGRAPFQAGYSAAASAGVPGIAKQKNGETVVDPNENPIRRLLLGSQDIPTLPKFTEQQGKNVASIVGAHPDKNTSLAIGAPLVLGSFFLKPGANSVGKAEEVMNSLSKMSNAAAVANKLKIVPGLTDDIIKKISPAIAKTTNKNEIADLVRQGIGLSDNTKNTAADATQAIARAPQTSATNAVDQLFHGSDNGALKVDNLNTETGPKNVTDFALQALKSAGVSPSPELEKTLVNVNAAKLPTPKTDFLETFKAPAKVLSQHFGKVGGDIAYNLQNAAKTVEQGRNELSPLLDSAEKTFKGIATTAAGKKDVSARVMQALEDRGNAAQYLHSDAEKKLFDHAAALFDYFKQERVNRGLPVIGENYSPRAAVSDALQAPERLLENVRGTFSKDVTSQFSKERKAKDVTQEIENSDIVSLMRRYANSQLKEFGYKPAVDHIVENINKVNPMYLANRDYARQGEQYLQKMLTQGLNPQSTTAYERGANRLLQNTYKNQLSFNPRFIGQNSTQKWIANAEVNHEGVKVSKLFSPEDRTALRSQLSSGDNPLFSELSGIEQSGVKGPKQPGPLNISNKVEMHNINYSFDRGAGQAIAESPIYKDAIKNGTKPADAVKLALQDPATKELAIRRGNKVVNTTQFGANIMTKPEFFRETGLRGVIPKSFVKQYGRFQAGMMENISQVMNMKHARELDVLMRGNPAETNIVEFKKAAEGMHQAAGDVLKAVKKGEISNVGMGDAQAYYRTVGKLISSLDDEIKNVSQLRGHKTAYNFIKMWAAAAGIQFLFSGGGEDNVGKSVRNASPINMPGRVDQAVPFLIPPSLRNLASPDPKARARAVTNFIPGVGLVVNRGHDINQFIKSIERSNQ